MSKHQSESVLGYAVFEADGYMVHEDLLMSIKILKYTKYNNMDENTREGASIGCEI